VIDIVEHRQLVFSDTAEAAEYIDTFCRLNSDSDCPVALSSAAYTILWSFSMFYWLHLQAHSVSPHHLLLIALPPS